jgi:hypothetical protein
MTATDILKELKSMGKESYKKLLFKNYAVKNRVSVCPSAR